MTFSERLMQDRRRALLQILLEVEGFGLNEDLLVEAIHLSEGWYRDNMPRLKAAFEDGSFSLPADAGVVEDFQQLTLVRGVARVPDIRRIDIPFPLERGRGYQSRRRAHKWFRYSRCALFLIGDAPQYPAALRYLPVSPRLSVLLPAFGPLRDQQVTMREADDDEQALQRLPDHQNIRLEGDTSSVQSLVLPHGPTSPVIPLRS